jgi:hypothetical protein
MQISLSDWLKGKTMMAVLKLALVPTPDIIGSFDKLPVDSLLCARFYIVWGVK